MSRSVRAAISFHHDNVDRKEGLDTLIASALFNMHPMASAKTSTEKRRKTYKVQVWVSPEMKKKLETLARSEGRTVANLVRRELSKITGIPE